MKRLQKKIDKFVKEGLEKHRRSWSYKDDIRCALDIVATDITTLFLQDFINSIDDNYTRHKVSGLYIDISEKYGRKIKKQVLEDLYTYYKFKKKSRKKRKR